MKRLFWLGAGLAVGVLVVRAASKKARAYSPRGIAGAAASSSRNLLDSVRDFVDDVRDGMHERERELRAALADGADLDDIDDFERQDDDLGDLGDLGDEFDEPVGDSAQDLLARHPPEGPAR